MSSTTVTPMSSNAVRDPLADHLITPQNSAFGPLAGVNLVRLPEPN